MFCEKGVPRNFTKITGKQLCQSLFFKQLCQGLSFNKVAGLRPATLLKKRLWHRCFPVNFVKFLRTPFLTEHLWLLLLHSWRWELPFLKLTFTRYVHSLKWYQVKKKWASSKLYHLNIILFEKEANVHRCSSKYVLLKFSLISQENTCVRVFFPWCCGLSGL